MASDTASASKDRDDEELRALLATMTNSRRSRVIHVLATRPGSAGDEIAARLGLSAAVVRKELRALIELGMVEVRERETRRGVQKLYFANRRLPWIKEDQDPRLSRRQRQTADLEVLRDIVDDTRCAIAAPDYGSRPGRMVASLPGTVDARAWRELSELHHALLERSIEIIAAGNARLAEGDEEPLTITSALLLLELPPEPEDGGEPPTA